MSEMIAFDHQLFRLINSDWSSPFLDSIFVNITDVHKTPGFIYIFLPFLLCLLIWRKKWEGLWIFFGSLVTLGLADWLGGQIVKPFFARSRPPLVLDDVIMRAPHFGGHSFTSNHASNIFCAAIFFGFYFPKARPYLIIYAMLVAYSRVYCGIHFPADVIVGGLWGGLLGFLGAKLFHYAYYHFMHKKRLI